jgi:hypothetical protein
MKVDFKEYLNKSIDLAERLLDTYESRPGIPYASINLGTGAGIPSHFDGGASSTAEASTLQSSRECNEADAVAGGPAAMGPQSQP